MDVRCESCSAQYKVDDAKIPAQGIKAKCPKCGHSFFLKKPEAAAPPPPVDFGAEDGGAIAIEGDQGAPPVPPSPLANAFGGADPFGAGNPFGGSNPFGGGAGAPAADPFAAGFGGAPSFGGGSGAPAADPFASGGVFGGGGFGQGGFDAPPPGEAGIGGLFNAKTAFEIQRADGQQIGPFDMFTLKQMIYEQQLDGTEKLNDATGNWVPISSIDELGEIFRLTGTGGAPAASNSADGGGWGNEAPAAPAGGGWAKHESVAAPAPAPAPIAPVTGPDLSEPAPAPIKKGGKSAPVGSIGGPAVAPAPIPMSIDAGAKRSMGERVIILTENLWALSKKKSVRIALGVFATIALVGALGWIFRAQVLAAFGLDKRMDASRMIAEGDRTLMSGERGPLLGAMASYEAAVARFPQGADGLARLAEVQASLWQRDPARLDMKAAAEANLAKAVAESPEEASVQRATARLAIGRRDAPAAEAALAKAGTGEGGAADPAVAFMRGEIAYLKGDLAAAEAAWAAAAQGAAAGQSNAWLARARAERGDMAAAKTAAETALKTEPDNGLAQVMLAITSAKTGGDAAAAKKTLLEVLNNAAQRSAVERARAAYYLAVLSEEGGAVGAALGYVRSAVQLYPADADSVAAAKRLFATRFPDKPVDPWIAGISKVRGSTAMLKVQEGEAQYALRNWQGALSPLLAAASEDTASARAQYALGRLLVDVGGQETVKAKGHFEKALALDPDYADAAVALSRWELAAGNPAGARAAAEKAIATDPTLPGGYQAAGSAALAANDPATAEAFLITATDLDPDSYLTWLDLGESRRLAGRPDDALAALLEASKLQPDIAAPKVSIGMAHESKGDFKQALEFFESAAAIEPANPNIAARVGITHVKAGNYADGKKKLEAVVKANPQIAEAQYYLGVAHQFSGDPEKAVDDYRQAIKYKYVDSYLAHYHLGEIFAAAGANRDADTARSHLEEALKLKPDYYQAHEELAKLYKAERQFPEALKALRDVETAIAGKPKAERDPVLERVIIAQGNIAKEEGKNGQATALFKKVLGINPRAHEAHFNLGELARDTSPGAAKKHYRDAITANKSYAPPYKVIGYMEKDNGSCRMAKSYWTTFIGLSAPPEEIKEIELELSNLDC